jgi:hypothetical protein
MIFRDDIRRRILFFRGGVGMYPGLCSWKNGLKWCMFALVAGLWSRGGVRFCVWGNISLHLRCGAVFIRSGSGVRERASLERPSLFSSPSL